MIILLVFVAGLGQAIAAAKGLPAWAANGYEGGKWAHSKNAPFVSIGYGSKFTIKVPHLAPDALPFFKQAFLLLQAKKGGKLQIGPGTFFFSDQFYILSNNTRVEGAGMEVTVLKLKNNAMPWRNAGFLRGDFLHNITVAKLALDGNKKNQKNKLSEDGYGRFGVYTEACHNLKFEKVMVRNWLRYGFDPHGIKNVKNPTDPKTNFWGKGLTVIDCVATGNGWDGFTLDQTYNVYVARNLATNNGRYGFNVVTASRNVLVENNIAKNNGFGPRAPYWMANKGNGCGFTMDTNKPGFDVYNVTVRNNVAINSYRGGFCVKDSGKNIVITHNEASKSLWCAHWSRAHATFSYNKCSQIKQDWYGAPAGDNSKITYVKNTLRGPLTGVPAGYIKKMPAHLGHDGKPKVGPKAVAGPKAIGGGKPKVGGGTPKAVGKPKAGGGAPKPHPRGKKPGAGGAKSGGSMKQG